MLDLTNLVEDFVLIENKTGDFLEDADERVEGWEDSSGLNFQDPANLEYSHCLQLFLGGLGDNKDAFAISLYFDLDCLQKLRDELNKINFS